MKHRLPGKRSSGGRPRKEGERGSTGRLKPQPIAPNAIVLAGRVALLGSGKVDLTKAENPLDLALARGWLTEQQHRDARRYAALYQRAGVDLPRLRTASLGEGEGEHSREARRAGVVETSAGLRPARLLEGDPAAHDTLRLIWAALKADERTELLNVAVLDSWPQWLIWRALDKPVPRHWERRRYALVAALTVVEAILDPRTRRVQNDMEEVA